MHLTNIQSVEGTPPIRLDKHIGLDSDTLCSHHIGHEELMPIYPFVVFDNPHDIYIIFINSPKIPSFGIYYLAYNIMKHVILTIQLA